MYTVPSYKVYAHNYVVSDNVFSNGVAINWARATDQIMFSWFPSSGQVVVSNMTFVSVDTDGMSYSNAVASPSYGGFNFVAVRAKEITYDLATSECSLASTLGMWRAIKRLNKRE